ncbi:alpha/beta-hydrolase [Coniochaeta ligniaria NRRL 30616]|uniref:Alpha/beta-hydrolase n=1 Tax=Coniochaeta ligniaria NRRL 30616 TaxID=1408157 RepID=A0A1J7J817_9PEZI|nr:alpha/beta-hydrolase [Coniochaeta ligniaria NRRL 30616]
MGFFDRSKKVKKGEPSSPPQGRPVLPAQPQFHASLAQLPPAIPPQQWNAPPYQPPPAFQPAGLLPAPPGWHPGPQAPPPYQPGRPPYAPMIVNQHYYFTQAPPPHFHQPQRPHTSSGGGMGKLNMATLVDTAEAMCPGTGLPQLFSDGVTSWHHGAQTLDRSAALYDQLSATFNDVMTSIDRDAYSGDEKDLFVWQPESTPGPSQPSHGESTDRGFTKKTKKSSPRDNSKGTTTVASSLINANCFAKVELYANSRLPMDLPPLRLYIPTYPLLCLAAQFSERAYDKPRGAEREAHLDASWRHGTKAMVIKSVPMDHMDTIVFAIRGTATFADWVVNLNMAPASPLGFLDDPGNLCHAGFLSVARGMVAPVAARLRQLLREDPGRAGYSLLITGHSAGGAVASLLYSHMLATSREAESELNLLTGCFRRVHCVTFGSPPVSLLPLARPDRVGLRKSLFLSFVNEGDPVARADPAYVRALLGLYAAPPPVALAGSGKGGGGGTGGRTPKEKMSKSSLASSTKTGKSGGGKTSASTAPAGPVWKVPQATLSSAGRIVVLRSGNAKARLKGKKTVEERLNEGVVAQITTDEQLRTVIWGDPVCHLMRLYAGRIETLAVGAVTARGY